MKEFEVEKANDLSDVFFAVMGGRPEKIAEIEAFMAHSPLKELFFAADMNRILEYDGFFAEEAVDAVYALLPAEIRLSPTRSWLMTPQEFRQLNAARINRPASRFIDVSLSKAMNVYFNHFKSKISELKKLYQEAQQNKQPSQSTPKNTELPRKPETKINDIPKDAELPRKPKIKTNDIPKKQNQAEMSLNALCAEERKKRSAAARHAHNSVVYRQRHKQEISQKRRAERLKLKAENSDLLKEMDKKRNSRRKISDSDRRYFQKHKAEIRVRLRENPKTNEYKRKYRNKIRFMTKTGPQILALLNGIAAAKCR